MKGDTWRMAVDKLVKGLKLRLKVEKLTGSCCNAIYLSGVLGAHAGVSIAKKGIPSLISHTFKEGPRAMSLMQAKPKGTAVRFLIRGAGGLLNETEIPRVGILNDTKCAAVEAGFVMVSSVDSISANLKGNPGLALAARAVFQDHTDKFLWIVELLPQDFFIELQISQALID
ncbi:hypothetical protein CISIN_1g0381531mg, partial [Citrus sinensis]